MHVLAKVASGNDENMRQAWADKLIATLEPQAKSDKPPSIAKPEITETISQENIKPAIEHQTDRKFGLRPWAKWGAAILALPVAAFFFQTFTKNPVSSGPMRVAVMQFENLSPDRSFDFISAGMTDDIIQSLTQIPDLSVTPRRDSNSMSQSAFSIAEIGDKLNVDHVLEGTIRIEAGRMKLNAVLINTASGEHIWSGQFNDQTGDIFSIQEDVANGITDALNIYLSPERQAQMFDFGTENVEAYRQYLRGRHLMKFWHETHTGDDIWRAGEALEAAVDADPSMARAWVHMTDLYHHYAADHIDPPQTPINVTVPVNQAETVIRLREVLSRAEQSRDESVSLQARANRIFFSEDWTGLRKAVLDYASHVTPKRGELEWLYTPILLVLLGETESQTRLMDDRVLRYDPGNATGHAYVVRQYLTSGEYEKARTRLDRAVAHSFSSRLAEVNGYLLFAEGNGPALLTHVKETEEKLTPLLIDYFTALGQALEGNNVKALEILEASKPLARERIHLALARHHIGQSEIAAESLARLADEPIGPMQIAVQLSYGAGCGPNPLPAIPALDKRMADAAMVSLPCIGKPIDGLPGESLGKSNIPLEKTSQQK